MDELPLSVMAPKSPAMKAPQPSRPVVPMDELPSSVTVPASPAM
jgi:hypothetical protein